MKLIENIIEVKLLAVELVKDSPLLLYVAFYEPFHTWLINVAEGWNPILKFFLNIFAVAYGVARVAAIIKNWNVPQKKGEE